MRHFVERVGWWIEKVGRRIRSTALPESPPVEFERFSFDNQKFEILVKVPGMIALMEAMTDFFRESGAINCVEQSWWDRDLGEMVLLVQRKAGKTPMDLKVEAEAKVRELESKLASQEAQ